MHFMRHVKEKSLKEYSMELLDELSKSRMIVLVEEAPLSNRYRQLMLSQKEFRTFVEALDSARSRIRFVLTDTAYQLPDVPESY